MQRLIFASSMARRSTRAEAFLDACLEGGINAELSTNILREIWEKYVFLVRLSGTTTAMRSVIGPIRENPQTRAFCLTLCGSRRGRNAHGVDLATDYGRATSRARG